MAELAAGPSGPGTVILELGAGIGVLVLRTPPGMDGAETEISRDGDPEAGRTHSRVRRRELAAGTTCAAVYPSLPEGRYTIWRDTSTPPAAAIADGQVTTCDWPG